jgi:hypothetical protein
LLLNGSNKNLNQDAPADPTTRMDLEDIYPVGSATIGKTLYKLPDDELQDLERRLGNFLPRKFFSNRAENLPERTEPKKI